MNTLQKESARTLAYPFYNQELQPTSALRLLLQIFILYCPSKRADGRSRFLVIGNTFAFKEGNAYEVDYEDYR